MSKAYPSKLDGSCSLLHAGRPRRVLPGSSPRYVLRELLFSLSIPADCLSEFTEHQRTVFCVFSGDGVNRLRKYLNENSQSIYDPESTMDFEDREVTDGDNDQQIASLMNIQGINDEEEDDDDTEAMEGSQIGGEVER